MQGLKKIHLLQFLISLFFQTSLSQEHPLSYCEGIEIQPPLSNQINSSSSSSVILCKSDKLYLRSAMGLFRISDINYRHKLLTITPHHLPARFPNRMSELGTRISFDVPDHVPNPCDECRKPNGNCGVGLRCLCQPEKCKDKVISVGAGSRLCHEVFFYSILVVAIMVTFGL